MPHRRRNVIGLFSAAVAVAFLGVGQANAAHCGFATIVAAGAAGGGTGFVLLYEAGPPFAYTGGGAVTLGTAMGDACMDLWRDSTMGPPPPNFNAIFGTGSASCLSAVCDASTPSICSPVTFCMAFP